MSPLTRTPYNGTTRKLILAFDIGTTYSGAAYAFLDPGQVPEINPVTKYLNNAKIGTAKVPSILYYDLNGNFRGVENGTGLQDDESLIQMKWWKLLLNPAGPPAALRNHMSTNLPAGKTIIDIFSDLMRYLFDSAKAHLISSDENGEYRWNSVSRNIELVLTHPNGWGGPQQSQLRTAAVRANIVPNTPEGHARVHFVTEGEASFNFCAGHTQAGEDLKYGDKVLIVDAGGGTIDISSYVVTDRAPLQVEELFRPECLLQGGELVTARAMDMVSDKLKHSRFDTPEDIASFAQKFDEGLKRVFFDENGAQFIKFGSPRDNDPKHGIKAGKLSLTGTQVKGFFEPSIQSTVDTIRDNFTEILPLSSFAFLVGGFAASPWLFSQLNRRLSDLGLKFFRPDTSTDKAVAVGAISFHIDHFVKGRISRFTYGTPSSTHYKASNPEHVRREYKTFLNALGEKCVPGVFTSMLLKGAKVLEAREIRKEFAVAREGAPADSTQARIMKYDGSIKDPRWMDVDERKFETLCYVTGDISEAPCTPKIGKSGKMCYIRKFDVVLLVGLTELKAQIRWKNSRTGEEKRGDAVVVYKDVSENTYIDMPRVGLNNFAPPPRYEDHDPDW